MFHDERIIVEQGKAFRATMMLAWFISLLYGILHGLSLYTNGAFHISALISEFVCLGSGLALFLYSEIKYIGSAKDEMLAYQKNIYYKKIFYVYIGIILFAYCLQIGLGNRYEWFPPNHFLFTLQIPCWLLLLTYFKTHGVPFNYSYLGENKNIYIRRTFTNVLKLGKIVAAATGMGSIIFAFVLEPLSQVVHYLIDNIGMKMGPSVQLVETTLYIESAVDYLLLVLRAVLLITATTAFVKKNIVKKTAYIYPVIVLFSNIVIHIWAMLSNFGQQIAYVVFSILAILLSIIIAISYLTGKKTCQ